MIWWDMIFQDLQKLKDLNIQRMKYVDRLERKNRELKTNRWNDIKHLKEKIEQQKVALKSMEKENKKLREDVEYRRTCYEDLRRIEWYDKIKLEDYLKD